MNDKFSIDYSFEIKEAEDGGDGYFYFEGYGSTKDLDLVNDIVEPTAFNESLKKRLPVMLWQHDRDNPIGVYTDATPDSKGLKVRGKMPLDDDLVKGRVVPQLKAGSVAALSIGFRTIKSDMDHERGIRIIKEADLLEISLVTFPANPEAQITALKSWAEKKRPPMLGIEDLKKENFAVISYRWDADKAAGRMGIEKAENNIQDIIEGKAFYVPRAIFAMRVAIDKGVYTEDYIEDMKEEVNLLYEALELPEPFIDGKSRAYCKTELCNLRSADLTFVLRYKELSKDASCFVAGAVETVVNGCTSSDTKALGELIDGLKKLNEEVK